MSFQWVGVDAWEVSNNSLLELEQGILPWFPDLKSG